MIDRHLLGDDTPYAFVTRDWGAHWTRISDALPAQPARSIRPDPRNPHLVYLGLEDSFWLSYDGGAHWRRPALGLPTSAAYDMRVQPRWNDLIVATHGRAIWILDDLTPIQQLPQAEAAGVMLFAPRPAYLFSTHANDEDLYAMYVGKNPPGGALLSFYQTGVAPQRPEIEILDARGRVVRHLRGTLRVNDREIPLITNFAGINRVTWDLREDGPVRWAGAAKEEYRGPRVGVTVVPGTYTVRMRLAGRTLSQQLRVLGDPRARFTAADYRAAYDFAKRHVAEMSRLNATLNRLDAYAASARARAAGAGPTVAPLLDAVRAKALALRSLLTADFTNGEDSIQHPGRIREDLQSLQYGAAAPPSAAVLDYAARVDRAFDAAMRDVAAFERGEVARADAALAAAGQRRLDTSGAKRADVLGEPAAGVQQDEDD